MGGEKARAKTSMPWRERGIRGAPLFASAFARAARTSSGDGSCDSDVSRDIPSPVEARVARRDAPEPDAKLPGLLVQKSGQVGDVVTVDSYFVFYPRMSKQFDGHLPVNTKYEVGDADWFTVQSLGEWSKRFRF